MDGGTRQDRLYTAVVVAFLIGLVAIGLLGVPALLVAGGGALFAAVAIIVFRRSLEAGRAPKERLAIRPRPVADRYVPSVLEKGSIRRHGGVHRHRRLHPGRPVRFR